MPALEDRYCVRRLIGNPIEQMPFGDVRVTRAVNSKSLPFTATFTALV